jgi:hypothetical protein
LSLAHLRRALEEAEMKEQCDLDSNPGDTPLHWVGDNFGADTPAIVDVQDTNGEVLHLNVSEALDRAPDIDQAGRRRIEDGIGLALKEALCCMQESARSARPPTLSRPPTAPLGAGCHHCSDSRYGSDEST